MPVNEDAVQRMHQRVGTLVRSKYRLERLLGVGGMAAVFEATHRNGGRVALKVLHPELARFPDVRTRFLREGYVANRIAHPGVVRIMDDDEDEVEKTVFLVMDLLDGETVEGRRERYGGRLPQVETLDDCDRVLDVLAVAHEQGIIHRDIKPDNLFLTRRGELKVLDFGIARLLDGTGATGSGDLLGTPAYMSPEQANGRIRQVDARSDLWSVGALLFTLLTGSEVHEAATPAEQLIYAATQPARPIESLTPWLEHDVAALVNGALAFDQSARWPSARAMQTALRTTAAFAACLRFRSNRPPGALAPNPAIGQTVVMPDRAAAGTRPHGSGADGVSPRTAPVETLRGPAGGGGDRRR